MTADLTDPSTQTFLSSLSTLLMAEFPVYYAIAKETGLLEDLTQTWGADDANKILAIAFHWMHTSSNSAYLFKSWGRKTVAVLGFHESKGDDGVLQRTRRATGLTQNFLQRPYRQTAEDEVLVRFHADCNGSCCQPVCECGKEGRVIRKQVGLALLLEHKTGMPVLYRMFPGQIADVSTVADMLLRFDEISDKKKIFAAVMDRGYFSLENFARFVDSKKQGYRRCDNGRKWIWRQ